MPRHDNRGLAVLPRRRVRVLIALAGTIALGLASRRWPLPGFLAEYTGDALYTVALFFGLLLLAPAARGRPVAGAAFLGSALIEFGQRLQWPWLVELRATRFGGLVLGQGFQWADLGAYAVGACLAVAVDAAMRARARRVFASS